MKTTGRAWQWISAMALALAACAESGPTGPAARGGAPVPMASDGSPRLWRGGTVAAAPAATPAASALALVDRIAPRGTVELTARASLPIAGGTIVRVEQRVDGVAVDGGELRVLVGPGGALLAASGAIVPAAVVRDRGGFVLDAADAVGRAIAATHGVDVRAGLRARTAATAAGDDGVWFTGAADDVTVEEARARQRWFRDGDALVAAWVVEAFSSATDSVDTVAERTVIAARDGRVLARRSLTADAFTYRVWANPTDRHPLDGPTADFSPHPTGQPGATRPAFIAPSLVTVDGLDLGAGGGPDLWLPDGATETSGNNVDAYTDLNPPGGLTEGDFRATVTAPGVFDRVYDPTRSPLDSAAQQQAAITSLFYGINWLHDDWYAAGFTEAMGNGQADNYGRGGVAGDPLHAEAQDGALAGNRNNANMSTPDDGMTPRMQVYVWDGVQDEAITAQPGDRGLSSNGADFGPQDYDLTGTLIAGDDGSGTPTDGCEPLVNAAAAAGKIVLVERGNCSGEAKAVNLQAAGAIGAIIMHNVTGAPPQALPDLDAVAGPVTIPSMSTSNADGVALRAALAAGPVTVTLHRTVAADADGSLDTGLLAHEFGHYVHHRLSVCGTKSCGAMSEGWGDFIAMMTIARPGDALDGVYALSTYAANSDPYFGLRRAPYTTDTSKNAMTFRMIAEGVDLPNTTPLQFGGSNSEVHNAGEIWAEALWEAYMALQAARGGASYDEIRRTMQRYVVAGLAMAPPDATFTETRDAILAAVQAASPTDHDTLAAAFARRGLGSCALSPPRESADFIEARESFEVKGHALAGEVAVALDHTCDSDGTLDVGETATVTVPIVNAGARGLSDVTVTVTSPTAGLVVETAPVAVGALASYTTTTATFHVRLDAATGPAPGQLDVTIASPGGCAETQTVMLPVRLAADDHPLDASIDHFDTEVSVWTPQGDGQELIWDHAVVTALDRQWVGTDFGTTSDTALVSPDLHAGTGPVTVSFDHAFSFELSDQAYDGGLIEISTDGGANWVDAATLTSVPYNVTLASDSGNPAGGAMAFGGNSGSYPAKDRLTLDLGTHVSGQTFRIRFRIVTDVGVGAPGWLIDNLEVTGLTDKPFPTQGADDDACGLGGGGDDGGCCSTGGEGVPVTPIGAGLLAAALLVRRRRRG